MYTKKEIGNIGEDVAVEYLENMNYKIIQRNFLSRYGEIDIIAKDIKSNEIVFIEVKTRTNNNYGKPVDAINYQKVKHIYKTAQYYIKQNKLEQKYIRFDAIEVYLSEILKKARVHHIYNMI